MLVWSRVWACDYLACVLAHARVRCVREFMSACMSVFTRTFMSACVHACIHVRVCARVCMCTFPNVCARGRAHMCACTRVRARCAGAKTAFGPMCSPASWHCAPGRKFHAAAKRDAPATLRRSPHRCVRRPEGRAVSLRRWHACLTSLSWRGFGCSSAAESRPRPSSVTVCYQIGQRCVAFTHQPVRTHPRAHSPHAAVAAPGRPS